MAIKIIREAAKFKPVNVTCSSCNTVFSADEPGDFTRHTSWDPRDGGYESVDIWCPHCNKQIGVDVSQFPEHIRNQMRQA